MFDHDNVHGEVDEDHELLIVRQWDPGKECIQHTNDTRISQSSHPYDPADR